MSGTTAVVSVTVADCAVVDAAGVDGEVAAGATVEAAVAAFAAERDNFRSFAFNDSISCTQEHNYHTHISLYH